jgi:hypothetical protein
MWVIVERRTPTGYVGVLDSDPGASDALRLRRGDLISFGAEHIVRIETPPSDYLLERFGPQFLR